MNTMRRLSKREQVILALTVSVVALGTIYVLLVDPHVLGAVAALIGEERETLETWLNEERAEGERTRRGERRRERER